MTAITTRQTAAPHTALPGIAVQAAWYIAGATLAFAVPYIFSSLLEWQHDWYLLAYVASMSAFLGLYVTVTHADVAGLFRRSWKLSLAVGVLATVFCVFNVLSRDATPRPGGAYFLFEILWRGAAYGTVDALVLTAFPVLIASRLWQAAKVTGWVRRAGIGVLALVLTMVITATYHLGYAQYREDGVTNPEIGNTAISIPAIVSLNPAGSLVTHATMHVTAVIHAYETGVFLPPQTAAR